MDESRKLIFVVEDDEEQLTLVRMILSSAGFDVVTESDADRVVERARSLRPDLIMLDVMLPSRRGLDGFALCQELRQEPEVAACPIIIVSAIAEGMGEMRRKVQSQVGADEFIMKPYDPSFLLTRIRRLCRME